MTPKRCAEIHAACFSTPRPWSTQEFSDLLASPQVFLCALEHGFALWRAAGPEAELLTIAVEAAVRGTGQGSALMQAFEDQARAIGAEELFLEVAADNTPAIALYTAQGYRQKGLRKDYYQSIKGPKVSALVFNKEITE